MKEIGGNAERLGHLHQATGVDAARTISALRRLLSRGSKHFGKIGLRKPKRKPFGLHQLVDLSVRWICSSLGSADLGASFFYKSGKQIHERLALVGFLQIVGMDKLVAEPGVFTTVEGLDGPVDQLFDARNPFRVGMIG